MEQKCKIQGNGMIYFMPPELDHHVADRLSEEVDMLIESNNIRRLTLDFRGTCFMDSSGIGAIIGRCKKMKYLNGKVKTANMNDRVYRLFVAAGLHRIIECEKLSTEEVSDGRE